ncbi:hypothetical protein MRX96_058603 [Rhipicephalus microplus]
MSEARRHRQHASCQLSGGGEFPFGGPAPRTLFAAINCGRLLWWQSCSPVNQSIKISRLARSRCLTFGARSPRSGGDDDDSDTSACIFQLPITSRPDDVGVYSARPNDAALLRPGSDVLGAQARPEPHHGAEHRTP